MTSPQPPIEPLPSDGEQTPTPRHPWRGHARLTLNLTAMIDVVFLLMIYFMVATEFKTDEEIYRLDLPARGGPGAPRDPFDLDEQPLRIMVSTLGDGPDAYSLRLDGPYDQPATFEGLRSFLATRRIGPGAAAGLFEPDHPIIISPTDATRWEHAVGAFNAVARAQYRNITLAQPR